MSSRGVIILLVLLVGGGFLFVSMWDRKTGAGASGSLQQSPELAQQQPKVSSESRPSVIQASPHGDLASHGVIETNKMRMVGLQQPGKRSTPDWPGVPNGLRAAIESRAGDQRQEYRRRCDALRELGDNLSRADIESIYWFLESPADSQNLDPLALNSLKNDLLELLLRQTHIPDDLGSQMVAMYEDPKLDDVMRDYCIQHFAPYYNARWPEGKSTPGKDDEQKLITDAYWDAAGKTNQSFAGTALIGLAALSAAHQEFDVKAICAKALELAGDEKVPDFNRVTSMQLCGRLGVTNVLPVARQESQSGASTQLRMSAIATLGDIGTKDDLDLLADLSKESEDRIQTAAKSAVKRLKGRINPSEK